MNLKNFVNTYGHARARELAAKANTTPRYLYAIARGERRPSVELAKRLVKASNYELGLIELLDSVDWDERRAAS